MMFCFLLLSWFPFVAKGQQVKILIFGDSQKIVNEAPSDYLTGMQQVLTDPQTNDADFILQMGDLVEDNQIENWKIVQQAWRKLDGKIPYVLNVGNNDVFRDPKAKNFNTFFPLKKYKKWKSYVDHHKHHNNVAHRFFKSGSKWLVISLQYGADNKTVLWAEKWIKKSATERVILISHDANSSSKITQLGLKYPNVIAVLAGHTARSGPTVLNKTNGKPLLYLKTCFHDKKLDLYGCHVYFDIEKGTISGKYYATNYQKFWDNDSSIAINHPKRPIETEWSFTGFK
ncbi:metallophosphoesterase family protein [Flavobacterium sp. TSSA_36]|uniref:metallophosphoesterase family protein n=1 Tax=Flavobacterium sp. TSSA_36 TaxID=3447669 RepID=UPI003F37E81F